MSVVAAQLIGEVKITGVDQGKAALEGMDKAAEHTQSGFKSMLGNALSFAAGQAIFNVVGDAVGFLKDQTVDAVKAAMDHQQIMSQTVQALKSTRDASGETASSIDKLATSFSDMTPFTEDSIQSAENLELTFTNIGRQVFPQATQAILDVSQAMGQDLKSSTVQIGKALGDPIAGLTALSRIGVTFDAQEKEQIKTMMKHNDIIGAQKIILSELSKEFGGSATAAGRTFGGEMDILDHRLEDIKIKVGTALLPVLNQLVGVFEKDALPILDKVGGWLISTGVPDLEKFASSIQNNVTGCTTLHGVLTTVWSILGDLGGIVQTVVKDVEPFATGIADATTNSGLFQDVLQAVHDILPDVSTFVSNVGSALDTDLLPPMESLVTNVGQAVGNFTEWLNTSGTAQDALSTLGDTIGTVAQVTGTLVGWMADLIGWFTSGGPQTYILVGAISVLGAAFLGLKVADMVTGFGNMFAKLQEGDGIVSNLASSFKGKLGGAVSDLAEKFFPNLKKSFDDMRGKADEATTSTEGDLRNVCSEADKTGTCVESIGESAQKAEGEVATAATGEETSLEGVATAADTTATQVDTIGAAAGLSATEVAAAATEEEAALGAVGAEAQAVAGEEATATAGTSVAGAGAGGPGIFGAVPDTRPYVLPGHKAPPVGSAPSLPGNEGPRSGGAFAGGGTNIPEGWSWVGEQGPELTYVPGGTNIYPHDVSMSMLGGGGGGPTQIVVQAPPIYLDGRLLANGLLPHIVDLIRLNTGVRF